MEGLIRPCDRCGESGRSQFAQRVTGPDASGFACRRDEGVLKHRRFLVETAQPTGNQETGVC
ncbi:hypothetical protein THTE_3929 [Thermogutta terrifontis]|uniref:Uncharacterized protein n=1 Tax=Thermogutta terrifontis TaxID=1331910 RepID=A0A286RKQ5_9BACT|nr:hypothetical protein THTE_3929 [Thermogutta terrifontis]